MMDIETVAREIAHTTTWHYPNALYWLRQWTDEGCSLEDAEKLVRANLTGVGILRFIRSLPTQK